MILTGREILRMRAEGRLTINPFDESSIGPNSCDLTLGDRLLVYTGLSLDPRRDNPTEELVIPPEGRLLQPGVGYLASTVESAGSSEFVCHVDGKSSLGRLFLQVHCTAGRGDLGYCAPWTLELVVVSRLSVRIFAGMKIAQASFHAVQGDRSIQYRGRYARQQGPTACRMYLDDDGGLH